MRMSPNCGDIWAALIGERHQHACAAARRDARRWPRRAEAGLCAAAFKLPHSTLNGRPAFATGSARPASFERCRDCVAEAFRAMLAKLEPGFLGCLGLCRKLETPYETLFFAGASSAQRG